MRKILVRFDDICPTMNWQQWKIATDLLDKYNIKPLIGVIPECKDSELQIDAPRSDFWDYVNELQSKGYAIAMHGVYHKYDNKCRGLVNPGLDTEFAGHPYEIQFEKIRIGKEILSIHGINTDIFFAPAHSYDKNTIRALRENGFKYMSDGKSQKIIDYNGLLAVPCRSGGVPRIRIYGYYTAVFHAHEWIREDKKYCYSQFVKLLDNYHNDIVSFQDFVNQPVGIKCFQVIIEKLYTILQIKIKPIIIKLLK